MYLLDTNALLVLMYNDLAEGTLTKVSMDILLSERKLYVSIVSCHRQGVVILPMRSRYMDKMIELPLMTDHGDPFDRMIMATALSDDMTLISTDHKVRRREYGVKVIW